MGSAALEVVNAGGLAIAPELVAAAQDYAKASRAPETRRAYAGDWRRFETWAHARGLPSLPSTPAAVALYLAHLAQQGRKASTIGRALVSISQAHKLAGHPTPRSSPAVSEVSKGLRRTLGTAPLQKAPALAANVKAMIAVLPGGLLGLRDRALLTVGFAGAFRRSELVGLNVEDLADTPDGLAATLRRSKTDQEGQGRKIGLPWGSTPATCAARAVRAWLDAAGIAAGPVFRSVSRHGHVSGARLSAKAVAIVVKRAAQAAGLDPALYSGHSLRAGLATSAAKAGRSERAIMQQTGHKSTAMLRRYIRDAELFTDNAAAGLL